MGPFLPHSGKRKTPKQNGMVERKNRTLVEMAGCLLHAKDLPTQFWAEVACCSNYILNLFPTRSVSDITPVEKW